MRLVDGNIYTNCGSTSDGWITPVSDLGTFEVSCYYFQVSSVYWDQAWKQCIDLGSGSMLAALETTAEFNWVLQMYNTYYASVGGFYVDATTNRYGSSWGTPSWRGCTSLSSSGVGSNYVFTSPWIESCYSNTDTYNQHFYMTSSGQLNDLFERSIISNSGYICKKFQSAQYPPTVGYNIGTCFPSLSGGTCPSGWFQFTPNSSPICYYVLSTSMVWEEDFRLCHSLGADMLYLESSSEINKANSLGITSGGAEANLNAHRYRYGPTVPNGPNAFYWSNGVSITPNQFGGLVNWTSGEPSDYCNIESCLLGVSSLNDISCHSDLGSPNPIQGPSMCKRPLCSTLISFL